MEESMILLAHHEWLLPLLYTIPMAGPVVWIAAKAYIRRHEREHSHHEHEDASEQNEKA